MNHPKQLLLACLSLCPAAGFAHHSQALYDASAEVRLEGTVSRYEWANPHVYVYLETGARSAQADVWVIEASSPSHMRQFGWSAETLAAGDRIVVIANPARDQHRTAAKGVLLMGLDGGSAMAMSATGEARAIGEARATALVVDVPGVAPAGASPASNQRADSLNGIWVPLTTEADVTRLIFNPRNGSALTSAAFEAAADYDEATMLTEAQCTNRTAPWIMLYPGVQQIEIGTERSFIRSEYGPVEREIRMTGVAPGIGDSQSLQGHSIGHWEDDVLVVETLGFSPHRLGIAGRVPSSEGKHLIERFRLADDGTKLTYQFELSDPDYLNRTLSGEAEWAFRPDLAFAPVACDKDNARQFLSE